VFAHIGSRSATGNFTHISGVNGVAVVADREKLLIRIDGLVARGPLLVGVTFIIRYRHPHGVGLKGHVIGDETEVYVLAVLVWVGLAYRLG
jgi:hypothetical protein